MSTPLLPLGAPLRREHIQQCGICHKGLMHTGLPLFWRVSIERLGFDRKAIERAAGLDLMIGPQLSSVMGTDDDLATVIGDADQLLICEQCALNAMRPIATLLPED